MEGWNAMIVFQTNEPQECCKPQSFFLQSLLQCNLLDCETCKNKQPLPRFISLCNGFSPSLDPRDDILARNLGMHEDEQMLDIMLMKVSCQSEWRFSLVESSLRTASLGEFPPNVSVVHKTLP